MKLRFSLAFLCFGLFSSAAFADRFQLEYDVKKQDYYVVRVKTIGGAIRYSKNYQNVDEAKAVMNTLRNTQFSYVRIGWDGAGYYVAKKRFLAKDERVTETFESVDVAAASTKLIAANWNSHYSIKYDSECKKYYIVRCHHAFCHKHPFSDPFDTLEAAIEELKKLVEAKG